MSSIQDAPLCLHSVRLDLDAGWHKLLDKHSSSCIIGRAGVESQYKPKPYPCLNGSGDGESVGLR